MEPAPGGAAKRIEVTPVQRQHIQDAVSIGEDNNRSICKPDIRVAILMDDAPRGRDVLRDELLQSVGTPSDLVEKAEFGVGPHPCCQEIAEFGQHEG